MGLGVVLQVLALLLAPANVTRGPVATQTTGTSAVVTWSMSSPVAASIVIADRQPIDSEVAATRSVTVTGLTPGQRYRYAIRTSDGTTVATGSLRTDPGPTGRFSAAVFGDYGDGGPSERDVAALASTFTPDLTVSTGDNVYLFAAGGWLLDPHLFEPLRDLLAASTFVPALGNHDTFGDGGAAFLDAFQLAGDERWYVARYGAAAFVVLDSDSPVGPATPQGHFLRAAVRSTANACFRIAVFHHPPFSPHSGRIAAALLADVVPVLERAGFQLVLLGHVHAYERDREGPTTYVTVGTGGATLGSYAASTIPAERRIRGVHGALRLDVAPGRLTGSFTAVGGSVLDRFTLTC